MSNFGIRIVRNSQALGQAMHELGMDVLCPNLGDGIAAEAHYTIRRLSRETGVSSQVEAYFQQAVLYGLAELEEALEGCLCAEEWAEVWQGWRRIVYNSMGGCDT